MPELTQTEIEPHPVRALRSRTRLEFVEMGGNLCRRLGLPRSLGQIYCLLFLSGKALSLDQIVEFLGISKASASNGTRQLAAWGAIRVIWIPGDRRDHYEVVADLADLLRSNFQDFIKPRLRSTQKRLDDLISHLNLEAGEGGMLPEDYSVCSERLKELYRIHQKLLAAAPLIQKLL